MFKLPGQRDKKKGEKKRQLWGRDFNIVKEGLDEGQVVSFVQELMEQKKIPPPNSVRTVLKTAIEEAEQIVASIREKAQTEAEEEAARIIAGANQKAGEVKEEVKDEPKGEAVEEDSTRSSGKAGAPEQTEAETSELVEESPSGEEEEAGSGAAKQESHPLYTGEVELAISKPVSPGIVAKLYNYLQTTPEIKFVRTSGSWERGTSVTVVLDKPISLISVLSSKIPEAKLTPERPEKDGFVKGKRGVRRITLSLKGG